MPLSPQLSSLILSYVRFENDDGPFLCLLTSSSRMALAVVIFYATACIFPALSGCDEYTRRAKAFSWFMLVFALLSLMGSGSMLVYQVSTEYTETKECSIDKVCWF